MLTISFLLYFWIPVLIGIIAAIIYYNIKRDDLGYDLFDLFGVFLGFGMISVAVSFIIVQLVVIRTADYQKHSEHVCNIKSISDDEIFTIIKTREESGLDSYIFYNDNKENETNLIKKVTASAQIVTDIKIDSILNEYSLDSLTVNSNPTLNQPDSILYYSAKSYIYERNQKPYIHITYKKPKKKWVREISYGMHDIQYYIHIPKEYKIREYKIEKEGLL